MLRKMFLAAITVAAVGFAQAVTVNWSNKQSLTGGATGSLPVGITTTGFSMAFGVTITSQPTIASNDLLVLTFNNNTAHKGPYQLRIGTHADGTLHLQVGNYKNWEDHTLTGDGTTLSEGNHVIGLYVYHNGTQEVVQVSIDGNVYSAEQRYTGPVWNNVSWSSANLPEGMEDAWVRFADGKVDPSEFGLLLPEPTALALLALGVAGVALRRKVA